MPIAKDSSAGASEKEVLLPPGYRILVTSVKQTGSNLYSDGAIKAEGIILPYVPWKG
jgi:hypothetical protein